jgi:hypothetical protein
MFPQHLNDSIVSGTEKVKQCHPETGTTETPADIAYCLRQTQRARRLKNHTGLITQCWVLYI